VNITFDKDKLNNANFRQVGEAGMGVITRLQSYPPEARILALASVFAQVCEVFKVRPIAAMEIVSRVNADKSVKSDELRAVTQYIKEESRQ
jgi:hypothetical protein